MHESVASLVRPILPPYKTFLRFSGLTLRRGGCRGAKLPSLAMPRGLLGLPLRTFAAAALLALAIVDVASAGEPWPDEKGEQVVDFLGTYAFNLPAGGGSDQGRAIAIQPDGRIVVAGFAEIRRPGR